MQNIINFFKSPTGLFILNLAVLFVMKVIDNILVTSKTILIQRNKGLLAAISVILSQVIFYKLIAAIGSSDNDLTMYTVAFASGCGTFLAVKFSAKFSKDKTYVNVFMCDDKSAMEDLRKYVQQHKMRNLTTPAYQKNWDMTIAITVYAETKEQSRLLDEYVKKCNTKMKRFINDEIQN